MLRNILVPIDFSANALRSALYAVSIAEKSKATIHLLHVIEPVTESIRQPFPLQEKLEVEITKNRIRELNEFQQHLAALHPGISMKSETENGMTIPSILHVARKKKVDLIVMGAKGVSAIKKVFMGSITAGIISRTHIPVLAVPDEYIAEIPDGILLATCHFEKSKSLLKTIADLASLFKTKVHVAVFLDTDTYTPSNYLFNQKKLNRYIHYLKKIYPDILFTGEILEGTDFDKTLTTYYKTNALDIIAMITYPKSFWEKLFQKSRTKKTVFKSAIPVLAIPST
ncbi:MAG TPA: universal stress protein [Chitinophagaceae bacterium]|nr:universal stress protein [Chitinophagaceae bacterium]HPH32129.1 universal stress protein [Chitinophagaceae bacterium]